jgi:predicted butyrate kinase (DUF1464 family)
MQDRVDANRDIFLRFCEEQRSKTLSPTVVAGGGGYGIPVQKYGMRVQRYGTPVQKYGIPVQSL